MKPEELIHRYCERNPALEDILLKHSSDVANRALKIADKHPEFQLDRQFLYEAAMLHDIGIVYVDAPAIFCYGAEPYIKHGLLGGEILRKEGLPTHARVAERHTGTGLTRLNILQQALPLPPDDYVPETLEEQIICYADKFYSKTKLDEEKTFERALASLGKFGEDGLRIFEDWKCRFE
ncbi:MAG: HD domain-containing protein [Bacteroidaceae bacterium]|nr:HD domain-containing protein [Bacteroidaceae bacterium]